MDNTKLFPCYLTHLRLTPKVFLGPFNSPKIKVMLKFESDQVIFLSGLEINEQRIIGKEPYEYIEYFTISHLSTAKRIMEILRKSLLRSVLWGVLFFLYLLLFRSYDLYFTVLLTLIGALFGGLFYFLLNGGLNSWGDIVRFFFQLNRENREFSFEIDPIYELEIRQELLSGGVRYEKEKPIE